MSRGGGEGVTITSVERHAHRADWHMSNEKNVRTNRLSQVSIETDRKMKKTNQQTQSTHPRDGPTTATTTKKLKKKKKKGFQDE